VIVDYFSNYIEVARLTTTTSRAVIKEIKAVFARYGIPDILVTDNGPQFAAAEFATFAETWEFKHTTSSPHHPKSNSKTENAVKIVKRIFTKCKASGQSEFLALLDWRNTPTEGIGTSPAHRLMGRRCRTLLPVAGTLLQPRNTTETDSRAIIGVKSRQRYYYNRHKKPLTQITPGERVHMKLPNENKWSARLCTQQVHPRSYNVKVGDTTYRHNCQQLICTGNQEPDTFEAQTEEFPETVSGPAPIVPMTAPQDSSEEDQSPPSLVLRSERIRSSPSWQRDYVIS